MGKKKNNQRKKPKQSKVNQELNVIDNVGAVSATDQTGAMPANTNAQGAENIDGIVNYKPKAKGKGKK